MIWLSSDRITSNILLSRVEKSTNYGNPASTMNLSSVLLILLSDLKRIYRCSEMPTKDLHRKRDANPCLARTWYWSKTDNFGICWQELDNRILSPYRFKWIGVTPFSQLTLTTYRCLNGTAPSYLAESICRVADVEGRRYVRSSATTSLIIPPVRRSTLGDRSFPVAVPRAWNSLPSVVRSASSLITFRRELKTFLYHSSFVDQWFFSPLYCFPLSLLTV